MKLKTQYRKMKYNKDMKYVIKKEILTQAIFEAGRYIIDNDERFKGTICHNRRELLKQVRQEGKELFKNTDIAARVCFNRLKYKFDIGSITLDDAKVLLVVGEYLSKAEVFGDCDILYMHI